MAEQEAVVEPVAPAAEPVVEPVAAAAPVEPKAEPVVEPAAAVAATPPAVEDKSAPDWKEKRIAQLTAKLRAAEAKAREAVTAGDAGAAKTQADLQRATQAEIDTLAETKAGVIASAREFTNQCNSAAERGREKYSDFDSRVKELGKVFDRNDPEQATAYNTMLQAALETGKAEELIYELGGDLNEASRVLSLPPMRMAAELMKKSLRAPEPVSGAAKPITAIGTHRGAANAKIDPDDPERADNLPTDEWMKRRQAQVDASRARH